MGIDGSSLSCPGGEGRFVSVFIGAEVARACCSGPTE